MSRWTNTDGGPTLSACIVDDGTFRMLLDLGSGALGELARRMRCPLIVDGRNSLDREQVTASGLEYLGIGR